MRILMVFVLTSAFVCNNKEPIEPPKTDPISIKIEAVHKTGQTITSQTIIVK